MLVRLTRQVSAPIIARLRLLPLVFLTTLAAIPALVAAQTPTADQIQIFQNLPADQQQSIIGTLGSGACATSAAGGVRSDRPVQFPNTVLPRNTNGTRGAADLRDNEYRLKGEDTLLLSLEIRESTAPDSVQVATGSGQPAATQLQNAGAQATSAVPANTQTPEKIERSPDLFLPIRRRRRRSSGRPSSARVLTHFASRSCVAILTSLTEAPCSACSS